MRNLRLLALLAPALLLPLACEDSSSSSGGTFSPEAGPGFEAGPTPEAGPLPDGAVPDTFVPPQGVTVTVLEGVTPKKDVRVILHDSTGAVTGEKLTDATGKATIANAPSMVTVLTTGSSSSPAPVTFAGVADGDNLRVVSTVNTFASAGTFDVSFVQGGVLATATSMSVFAGSGCYAGGGGPAMNVSVPLFADCVAAKNSVLGRALDDAGTIVGFGFAKDVLTPVAAGTRAVGPLTFTAPGTTTVTATNLPAVGGNTSTSAFLSAVVSGQATSMSSSSGTIDGAGVSFPTATGFADAYQGWVRAQAFTAALSERILLRREATTAPASATLAFDFNNALPSITGATLARPMPARPDITMTSAASLSTADAGIVTLTWFVPALDTEGSWTFVLPPSTTAFKVPALPADATDFVPSDPSVMINSATFFDASQVPSYGAAKTLPITPKFGVDYVDNITRPLPAAGTLRISRWFPNAG